LGQDTANVIVSQVVPPYTDPVYAQLLVIKKYVEYLKKYYPDDSANFVSLEGFINGMILVEGLMRAGKNLTRENFINAIESINPGEMDTGLNLSYGANDHVGIDRIYLTHIKGHSYVVVRN
ncbi:MAG: ABC transporter substrate-binding protein, partial [Candidatus Omnitrophota bacterium]